MEFKVSGAERIADVQKLLRAEANKGLGQRMSAALTKAVEPVTKAITVEAGITAPSGYQDVLTRSLKHRRTVRNTSTSASVRITTTAQGKVETRDIVAFDRGNLRHPVFGRTRQTRNGIVKNPWSVTSVKAGFHQRGTAGGAAQAEKQLNAVLDDYLDLLAKG